jgi:hypothetical protein
MDQAQVKAACDAAVRAIATLPIERWSGWAIYMLEALDARHELQDMDATRDLIVRQVTEAAQTRLEADIW